MSVEEIIMNYQLNEMKRSEKVAADNLEKLKRHPDIMAEFGEWINTRTFPKEEVAVCVEGYTSEILHKTTDLSEIGAYNYLIFLREDPKAAIEYLEAGMPIE